MMKFLTNLTLAQKIVLLPTLGLLIGVGVFSSLGMRAVNQATDTMLQERLTTANLVADYLDEELTRALTELEDAAQGIDVDAKDPELEYRMETLKNAFSKLAIFTYGIYLHSPRGEMVWSKAVRPEAAAYGLDAAGYPVVTRAIDQGATVISGLVSAPVTNTPVVLLSTPTRETVAGRRGALTVAVDLARSSITGFIQPVTLGKTGYLEIIDQTGIVLARTKPGPEPSPFEKSDHSGRFASLIAAGEPTQGLCHTCHEPTQKVETRDVLAFVPLSRVQWGVVIRQSETEALAPIRDLRQSLILFGLGLVTISVLFVALTTFDVTSRIRMLIAASKRISGGDLASPIAISRRDEVGALAETFEDMRNQLQKSYGELEQKTKELSSLLSVSEILSRLGNLTDIETALETALGKTLEIMKEETGGILLFGEDRQSLHCASNRGLYRDDSPPCPLDEGISGKAARFGETMIAGDVAAEPGIIAGDLKGIASVPLLSKEKVLGVLNIATHDPGKFSPENRLLLEGIARAIAVAVENASLHQEVQQKEQLRGELLQDLFSIQEEEQKRIARELHDETSQVVSSLTANLEAAIGMLPPGTTAVNTILRKAQALSINILDEIHRLIYELRPTLLDDLGLVAATRSLVDNNLKDRNIKARVKITGRPKRLAPRLEGTAFRVIQEAVNNIARHAGARNASISLSFKKSAIRVTIKDDGAGFDVKEAISSKDRPRGLGLLGMKERVELVNGKLDIRSDPIGGGTEIEIDIPLKETDHG